MDDPKRRSTKPAAPPAPYDPDLTDPDFDLSTLTDEDRALMEPGDPSIALYADTGLPLSKGQIAHMMASPPDPQMPEGTPWNPRWQQRPGDVPTSGTWVDLLGRMHSPDTESLQETMQRSLLRAALAPSGMSFLVAPSERETAFREGATSALLLGGKNEIKAGAAAIPDLFRGRPVVENFKQNLAALDARDRAMFEAYPLSYGGGAVSGTVAGGLLTPQLSAGKAIAADVALGAAGGFLGTDGDLKTRTRGAMFGAVASPVVGGAMRARTPATPSAGRALLDEGVMLTPGATAGAAGRFVEGFLSKTPRLGSLVTAAERKSIATFDDAALNRTLAPIGETLPKTVKAGNEAAEHADTALANAYDPHLAEVTLVPDAQFHAQLDRLRALVEETPYAGVFNTIIDNRIKAFGSGVDGAGWKAGDAALAQNARLFANPGDPARLLVADALDDVRLVWRDLAQRQTGDNPDIARINQGFADLVAAKRAARRNPDGLFTGVDLQQGVATATGTPLGRLASSGLGDLATAGVKELPQTVPTARPVSWPGIIGGGMNLWSSEAPLAVKVGTTAATAAYAPGGREAVNWLARNVPATARRIRDWTPQFVRDSQLPQRITIAPIPGLLQLDPQDFGLGAFGELGAAAAAVHEAGARREGDRPAPAF